MRLLLDSRDRAAFGIPVEDLDEGAMAALYAYGPGHVLRVNFVSTLDGSAVGADGRSGSINTPADNRVFALQRRLADAILVGAGTARAEGYGRVEATVDRPDPPPLVVVSATGIPPPGLVERDPGLGRGILLTRAAAGTAVLAAAREALGEEDVWVLGEEQVDMPGALRRLAEEGMPHVLAEGGPSLFTTLLGDGLVDEFALTLVPRVVSGPGGRVTKGPAVDVPMTPVVLLEEGGALLGLWRVDPSAGERVGGS